MTAGVTINGRSATVFIPGQWPADTNFHIFCRNTADNLYLGRTGWTAVATSIPADVSWEAGGLTLRFWPEAVPHIKPGSRLVAEDIFISMSEEFRWPHDVEPEAVVESVLITPDASSSATGSPLDSETDVVPDSGTPAPDSPRDSIVPPITRRSTALVALILGLILGSGAMYLLQREPSPVIQTIVAPPSPSLIARESAVTDRENTLSVLESTANADAKALRLERDQLLVRLKSAEEALGKASLRVVRDPPTTSVDGAELSQLRTTIQTLQQQLDDMRVDRSMVEARVTEQAQMIKLRDAEISSLRMQPAQSGITPDSVPQDTARWLAAAVDRGGSIQTITNQLSRESAEKIAMKLCGGGECRLVGSYDNACFSLSRPVGQRPTAANWWYAVDRDGTDAERRARRECDISTGRTCDTRFTVCSPASLNRP